MELEYNVDVQASLDEIQKTIIIEGEAIDVSVNKNNWMVPLEDLDYFASTLQGVQLRINHGTDVTDVKGLVKKSWRSGNKVLFEAEVSSDPVLLTQIEKKYLTMVSPKVVSDAIVCSLCNGRTRDDDMVMVHLCAGAYEIVHKPQCIELSIVAQGAYPNNTFRPKGFAAAMDESQRRALIASVCIGKKCRDEVISGELSVGCAFCDACGIKDLKAKLNLTAKLTYNQLVNALAQNRRRIIASLASDLESQVQSNLHGLNHKIGIEKNIGEKNKMSAKDKETPPDTKKIEEKNKMSAKDKEIPLEATMQKHFRLTAGRRTADRRPPEETPPEETPPEEKAGTELTYDDFLQELQKNTTQIMEACKVAISESTKKLEAKLESDVKAAVASFMPKPKPTGKGQIGGFNASTMDDAQRLNNIFARKGNLAKAGLELAAAAKRMGGLTADVTHVDEEEE